MGNLMDNHPELFYDVDAVQAKREEDLQRVGAPYKTKGSNMKNKELVKLLVSDAYEISEEMKDLRIGVDKSEFRKEIFRALVKLTAERGNDRWISNGVKDV